MALYPMKFSPILKKVIWGGTEICEFKGISSEEDKIGESWEISGVEGNVSVVSNGSLEGHRLDAVLAEYKAELLGAENYNRFGNTFPLLIKFIDARDNLSIQVHPDDELARLRHDSFGKTEMWYVIKAADGACLYSGFKKQITPEKYVQSIEDGTFMEYLDRQAVKAGDVFFLPAGRVHAIGAGTFIAEIQQTSNITYRIYDYKRTDANGNERELHTELAKDAIDYRVYESHRTDYVTQKDQAVLLKSCNYFTTHLLDLEDSFLRDYSQIDSFVVYICMEGEAALEDDKGNNLMLKKGESVLLPATTHSMTILPVSGVKIMETYVM